MFLFQVCFHLNYFELITCYDRKLILLLIEFGKQYDQSLCILIKLEYISKMV